MKTTSPLPCLAALLVAGSLIAADSAIDWERAKQLHQKATRGEKLSPEDQAYYERALAARKKADQKGDQTKAASLPPPEKWTQHLTPLTELGTGKYKGEDGGLYGGGKNDPPKAHLEGALKEAARVQPLDAKGKPSDDGKIVMLSVGMSNTTMEYSRFKQVADADPAKSSKVVIVDGAQGGKTGIAWSTPGNEVWNVVAGRLKSANVTPQQVQVIWLKQAEAVPSRLGEFPMHAQVLKDHLAAAARIMKQKYPNMRLVYLSNRIYAGNAISQLNPEPYSYENAFAVRWLIQDQIKGEPSLNYDDAKGDVKAPVLLWGPYLWGDGETPRKADGLVWKLEDFSDKDGTHPGKSAQQKVANLLLGFLKSDPTTKTWFVKSAK